MRSTFTRILLTATLAGGLSAVGLAQTATPQDGPEARAERREGRRQLRGMRRQHRRAGLRALQRLNLTDAQRERMRAAAHSLREANKDERAELRELMILRRGGGQLTADQQARARSLTQSLRESRKGLRQEMLGALTDEQRTQLEQWKKERRERREQLRQQRRLLRGETM